MFFLAPEGGDSKWFALLLPLLIAAVVRCSVAFVANTVNLIVAPIGVHL